MGWYITQVTSVSVYSYLDRLFVCLPSDYYCPCRDKIHEREPPACRFWCPRFESTQRSILNGPFRRTFRLKSIHDQLLILNELPFRHAAFIAASSIIVAALTTVIATSGNSFSFRPDVINYRDASRQCNALSYAPANIVPLVRSIDPGIDRSSCVRPTSGACTTALVSTR